MGRIRSSAIPLVLLASLSVSCASTGRDAITPLKVVRASPAKLHLRPDAIGLSEAAALPERPEGGLTAALRCRLYAAEPEWIERAIGDGYVSAFAVTSRSDEIEKLCRE